MFRILTIDGGGIKGVFAASALASIEELTGKRVANYFDLIAGTSTGGILAMGVALGIAPAELLQFYRTKGPTIFPSTSLVQRSVRSLRQMLIGPKHSHEILRAAISNVLGARKFGEANCRLVIPAYDAVGNRIYIFKTNHAPGLTNDSKLDAVDVAMATSAAPTYFAAASTPDGGRYVDGGIWANNPSLVALIEALTFLAWPLDKIEMLNIGATSQPFNIAGNSTASVLRWNVGLVNLMFESQAEVCKAQTSLLLGGRFHRIDYRSTDGRFALDDASAQSISDLAQLGSAAVRLKANQKALLERFFCEPRASAFVPAPP